MPTQPSTRMRSEGHVIRKMEVPDVKEGFRKLCRCLLDAAFHSMSDADGLLASLQLPSMNKAWDVQRREAEVRELVHLAYDILLLRKWTWFGDWNATPLSPLCWCVARGYEYHMKGRRGDGERLASALKDFSEGCKQHPLLVLLTLHLTSDQVTVCRRRSLSSSS